MNKLITTLLAAFFVLSSNHAAANTNYDIVYLNLTNAEGTFAIFNLNFEAESAPAGSWGTIDADTFTNTSITQLNYIYFNPINAYYDNLDGSKIWKDYDPDYYHKLQTVGSPSVSRPNDDLWQTSLDFLADPDHQYQSFFSDSNLDRLFNMFISYRMPVTDTELYLNLDIFENGTWEFDGWDISDFGGPIFVETGNWHVLARYIELPPDVVPVPAAFWLFVSGLLGLIGMARRVN